MTDKKAVNPYSNQPNRAFWSRTVGGHHPLDIPEWYRSKFDVGDSRIATAGSCFAQHIGRHLRAKGFRFVDAEPAPRILASGSHMDYGYGMYSARYGNVYTSRQLLQLLQRALGEFTPVDQNWSLRNGFVDAFRPTIEPEPFVDIAELEAARAHHLACVRELFTQSDVFVFTLGLTETWVSKADGAAYPIAPGVSGGEYHPDKYQLLNLSYNDVMADLRTFMAKVRNINPKMKFLLTVSPVPLMATATDDNVIVATTYSKSVLRAVAGQLNEKFGWVDYFPSYEIISSHVNRAQFYNPDMRTVANYGVEHVMSHFFSGHTPPRTAGGNHTVDPEEPDEDDVKCDEVLLSAFGEGK